MARIDGGEMLGVREVFTPTAATSMRSTRPRAIVRGSSTRGTSRPQGTRPTAGRGRPGGSACRSSPAGPGRHRRRDGRGERVPRRRADAVPRRRSAASRCRDAAAARRARSGRHAAADHTTPTSSEARQSHATARRRKFALAACREQPLQRNSHYPFWRDANVNIGESPPTRSCVPFVCQLSRTGPISAALLEYSTDITTRISSHSHTQPISATLA